MVPTTIDSTETLQDINEERCIRRTYRIRLAKVNCSMLTSQRGDAPNKKKPCYHCKTSCDQHFTGNDSSLVYDDYTHLTCPNFKTS